MDISEIKTYPQLLQSIKEAYSNHAIDTLYAAEVAALTMRLFKTLSIEAPSHDGISQDHEIVKLQALNAEAARQCCELIIKMPLPQDVLDAILKIKPSFDEMAMMAKAKVSMNARMIEILGNAKKKDNTGCMLIVAIPVIISILLTSLL